MTDPWTRICDALAAGRGLAAATIAMEDGSTPRSAGSKMLVEADGKTEGTVGGGLGEAMAINAAGETLKSGAPALLPIDMSGNLAEGSDLVCGGRMHIFVQRLDPDDIDVFLALRERLERGRDSYLVSTVSEPAPPALVFSDGGCVGTGIDKMTVSAVLADPPDSAGVMEFGGRRYFVESIRARTRLVLAGGGHVSLATARVATLVDFDVYVEDDREEFVAQSRFPWLRPERLVATPGFADCLEPSKIGGPVDKRCFIAILTRGHAHDYEVLARALRTPAGYIGMIGSRRKREQIFAKLLDNGFSARDLDRVHTPIGLDIAAETPAEIAVSIVAELIAARAAAHE